MIRIARPAHPGQFIRMEVLEPLGLKHHQATYEEFHATRPSLRWRHLVAAVQAAVVSHGRIQDIWEHAAQVMRAGG